MPKRIQRQRTKGWRMPAGAVYVGRPTVFGNPFPVDIYGQKGAVERFRRWVNGQMSARERDESSRYPESLTWALRSLRLALPRLRGKDLACFCPLDASCHADVLLEIANAEARDD